MQSAESTHEGLPRHSPALCLHTILRAEVTRDTVATSPSGSLDALRELILRGDFPAGARLGEVELAERLGVSRTPVREALSRLAAEGLVELAPNRGARVASWTVAELEGVFDLRSALEPRLTALAVPGRRHADIAALDELAVAMLDVGTPGPDQDLDAIVPLNREFHGRLVALADQPALASALAGAIHAPIVLRNFHTYDDGVAAPQPRPPRRDRRRRPRGRPGLGPGRHDRPHPQRPRRDGPGGRPGAQPTHRRRGGL